MTDTAIVLSDNDRLRIRALSDTGILCREVLGYNYDEDDLGRHINEGKGGIVDHGKTQEIIALLDDTSTKYKLIVAPRESRKSTMAQGFAIRNILLWPDIRIFYVARTDDMMRAKCSAIRAQLMRPEITKLFGRQQGVKWAETEFSVAGRTNVGLQNATLTGFSQESMPTGGRANLLIVDDFIDGKDVTTAAMNRKSKDLYADLQPFLAAGGTLVYIATIWADDDLTNDLMGNMLFAPPYGAQIVCGAGVSVITTAEGKFDLELREGGLTFPHLTLDHLRQKLWGMSRIGQFEKFVRQYLNETGGGSSAAFQRKFFKPIAWQNDMRTLSGYIVTDTAISDDESACYSVIAYVGLDASDNIYLLDLMVGNPDHHEFGNWFFQMLEEWTPRVNHCGECWESAVLSMAYRNYIIRDSRVRKFRLHTLEMKRPPQSQKEGRINRLQPVMKSGDFYVVDTVPKTFTDSTGEKVLWDPTGFYDARTRVHLPAGELVDEFIRKGGKKDIPDAIAMVLEHEKTRTGYRRMCRYKPYRPPDPVASLTEQRDEAYHREQYGSAGQEDWWEKTLRENDL